MICHNDQLSPKQLGELDGLIAACEQVDGGSPLCYPHLLAAKRDKNNFLYYQSSMLLPATSSSSLSSATHQQISQDQSLIGFLGLFFFYEDACEVSLLVHPAHRRQGVARSLLMAATSVLSSRPIKQVIFSVPASLDLTFLKQKGFELKESEYQMTRGIQPALIPSDRLAIATATADDVEQLVTVNEACFEPDPYVTANQFLYWLNDSNYHLLVARYQGNIIGKAHLRHDKQGLTYFSDIAILPAFQKQGLGCELLAKSINLAILEGATQCRLDVATDNASNAVDLYLRNGFVIDVQHDYWVIPVALLK